MIPNVHKVLETMWFPKSQSTWEFPRSQKNSFGWDIASSQVLSAHTLGWCIWVPVLFLRNFVMQLKWQSSQRKVSPNLATYARYEIQICNHPSINFGYLVRKKSLGIFIIYNNFSHLAFENHNYFFSFQYFGFWKVVYYCWKNTCYTEKKHYFPDFLQYWQNV